MAMELYMHFLQCMLSCFMAYPLQKVSIMAMEFYMHHFMAFSIQIKTSRDNAINSSLIFSAWQIKTNTCAKSEDPNEEAHNESSHQDLHCLPFCF